MRASLVRALNTSCGVRIAKKNGLRAQMTNEIHNDLRQVQFGLDTINSKNNPLLGQKSIDTSSVLQKTK
jgi:hypothetical protein